VGNKIHSKTQEKTYISNSLLPLSLFRQRKAEQTTDM